MKWPSLLVASIVCLVGCALHVAWPARAFASAALARFGRAPALPLAAMLMACAGCAGGVQTPRTAQCAAWGHAAALDGVAAAAVGTVLLVPSDARGQRRLWAASVLVAPGVILLAASVPLGWCARAAAGRQRSSP